MLMKWGDEKIEVSQILAQPLHSFMILDMFLHLSGFLVPHHKDNVGIPLLEHCIQ